MTNPPSSYTNSSIKLSIPQVLQIHRQWNEIHQILNKPHKKSKSHLSFFPTNFLINHTPNLNLELTNPTELNHQHTNNKTEESVNKSKLTNTSSEHSGAAAVAAVSALSLALSDSQSLQFGFVSFFFLFFIFFIGFVIIIIIIFLFGLDFNEVLGWAHENN